MKRFVVTYEAAGRYREAAERSVRWLELVPRSDEARQAFLRNVERIDEPSAAIGHLLSVAKNSPGRNALFLPLARHYRKLNDVQKAEEYINKSIDGDPGNPEAYLLSARWKMESGNRDEAEGVVSLAESREIHSFELHKLGLQLSLEKGDVGSAFRHLEFMTRTTSADLTPLKNRITALAQKLSAFPR